MIRTTIVIAAALALAVVFPAVPAQAAGSFTRTFVSSAGVDSNPCTITQPCATFAAAYNAVEANGIIAALDPGKYGPLTIGMAVTVNGNGWAAITGTAAGNGITVNAVSGNVILTGLEIDGAGAAYDGIVFQSGSSLTITNCIVQNFVRNVSVSTSGNGVLLQPTTGTVTFAITNSTFSNNGFFGLYYDPPSGSTATANGTIDHVVATNNVADGIAINTSVGGGSAAVAISNSISSNNSGDGIDILNSSAALAVSIDNSTVTSNYFGIVAYSTSNVLLGRTVITANTSVGVQNSTSPNTFYSYSDNRINGNGTGSADDVTGFALNSHPTK
jgi:hypothetical protein